MVSALARVKFLVAYLAVILLSFAAGHLVAFSAKRVSDGRVLLGPHDLSLLLMIVGVSVLAFRTRWFLEHWGELKPYDVARSVHIASRVVMGVLLAILAGLIAFLAWR